MTSKRSSTIDQINELLKPCPEIGSDSDGDLDTQAKVTDYDFEDGIDVEQSRSIISQVSAFADDPRYTGVKVTRKLLDKVGIGGTNVSLQSGFSPIIENPSDVGSESENNSKDCVSADKDAERLYENFDSESAVSESVGDDCEGSADDNPSVNDDVETYDEDCGSDNEVHGSDDDDVSISNGLGTVSRDKKRTKNISEEIPNSIQHISSTTNVESEVEKAKAVKNQLYLWDKILECRIRLQKSVSHSNRFPKYTRFVDFQSKGGSSFALEVEKVQKSCCGLLDKLTSLQRKLIHSYGETKGLILPSLDHINDNDIQNNEVDNVNHFNNSPVLQDKNLSFENFESILSSHHSQYLEYRNATIQKWNDRTKVSSGRTKKRDFSAFEQTTLQQIQHILSNRSRLIQRTRLRGSVGPILGDASEDELERDAEIFEDSDFYHQMLKEIIERHSDGSHDATAVGKRWAAIQKLRSKMKRHIDTRATKGRRLRFTPYPKLVGLMAPISSPNDWDERATGELFNSLFGQKKR